MGLIRKSLSISSLGLVDFKSDKERIATSTRKTKQAVRKGNKLAADQVRLLEEQNALLRASLNASDPQVQQAPEEPPKHYLFKL